MSLIKSGTVTSTNTVEVPSAVSLWQFAALTAAQYTVEFQDTNGNTEYTVTIPAGAANIGFVSIPTYHANIKVTGATVAYMAFG